MSPAGAMTRAGGDGVSGDGIVISGVTRSFGEVTAVRDLALRIALHSRVGVVGPSGCGKSTLVGLIAGLDDPDAGTIEVRGRRVAPERLASCALMPQKDLLLPWRSALDNACLALENRGMSKREAYARVRPMFPKFGLAGFEDRRPSQLSGGMRQRVSFLRTLVAEKEVLLLDEPFGALDSITRATMQQWLREALDREPRTVVLITHDVEEALVVCDEVVVLSERPGRVVERLASDLPGASSRRELVASPEFVALRGRAMAALEC